MNRIYRTIWNQKAGNFVAVSELAKSGGKKASAVNGSVVEAGAGAGNMLKAVAAALLLALGSPLYALPTDGVVVAGDATISTAADSMTITQNSQNVSLNWLSFDIGAAEAVQFVQPDSSSVALNRVLGADPSSILGSLTANGQVFLINPNGILFGQGASVNVGGLVASTLDISDGDFMAGEYKFAGTSDTSVINEGSISAAGGYVALLGANVSNQGVIAARLGTVALAAGEAITLDVAGDGLLNVGIDQGAVNALVANGGMIRADGGQVLLTAQAAGNLLHTAVNNTGVIQAQTIENRDGVIRLLGDMQSGTVNVGGTLDASAPNGGDGGFIDTSAATVTVADDTRVTTAAAEGLTGSWLIDPTDYTIAATGGDITGAVLSANLADTDIIIQSASGEAGTAGDVNVNDTVSWSANRLTLNAQYNININAAMHGSGTASLALEYGQGALATGNTGVVNVRAAIDLPSGANYSTLLGSDGITTHYTVITDLGEAGSTTGTDLQGINGNTAVNYALGGDIDASVTAEWNAGAGFAPIVGFNGVFDGLGHTIGNLTINTPDASNVGLFGSASLARFQNIGLTNASVTGRSYVGILVGNSFRGYVANAYSTGTVNGVSYVGGLLGLHNGGTILQVHSGADVTGTSSLVGGLVGQARFYGTIADSYATGTVNGSGAYYVGGLVGQARFVSLTNTYATGAVTGDAAGGLVGFLDGTTIASSYASGAVTGWGGGLVGQSSGSVTNSYWNVTTSGRATSAGGIGLTSSEMQTQANFTSATAANGNVNPGWDFANTWVQYDTHTNPLLRSFMTELTITANDASETYDGQAYSGGNGVTYSATPDGNLLGSATYGGSSQGAVNAGAYAISASGFYSTSQQGYVITYVDGTLTVDPASLTLSTSDVSRTYDGTTAAAGTATITSGTLFGTDAISGGSFTFTDKNAGAGDKTVTTSGVTVTDGNGGGNYTVSYADNTTSTIDRAVLTASASATDKIYDGTTAATATLSIVNGLVGGETVSATGGATFNSKDVSTANLVTVNSIILADGTGLAGNYTLAAGQTAAAEITAKALTVSGMSATDKTYDGNTVASLSGGDLNGLVDGETLSITGYSGAFADKNVGTGKAVTVSGLVLADGSGLAGNYSVSNPTGLSADITRLDSVSWVGGASGNWFDPANWAGGAVPDLANVASVLIPAGVIVSFDDGNSVSPAQAGAVELDRLNSEGGLSVVEGSLNIADSLQLASLQQSGGAISNGGDIQVGSFDQSGGSLDATGLFTVSSAYSQSDVDGSVTAGGGIGIIQASGSMTLGNISTAGSLTADAANGDIDQIAGTSIVVSGDSNLSAPNGTVTLASSGNSMGTAVVTGAGVTSLQNARVTATSSTVDDDELLPALNQVDSRRTAGNSAPDFMAGLDIAVIGNGLKLPSGMRLRDTEDDAT